MRRIPVLSPCYRAWLAWTYDTSVITKKEVYKKRVETSVLAINVLKSRAYIPELLFVRVHMPKYLSLDTFPICQ